MTQATFDRIATILHANGLSHSDGSPITLGSDLDDDLGASSLDLLEVVMEMEKEFGVDIDDSTLPRPTSVGDLVRVVEAANV